MLYLHFNYYESSFESLKDIRIITLSYAEHFDNDFFKLEKTGYLTFSMNNNVTHSFVGNKIFLSPP